MLAGLLPLLLVLAATFVYAGVAAGSNAYQIKRNFDVSHTWETRERLAAVAGFVLLAYVPGGLSHWWNALAPLLALGAAACLFGLRFDIRLNLRRGLPRFYLGTDPETAATDQQVRARGISGRTFAGLKLAGTVLLAAAALLLSGCRTGRPDVATGGPVPHSTSATDIAQVPGVIAPVPPNTSEIRGKAPKYVALQPPAPDAPARQHRQYRRNLRAQPRTVPLIQGRAAVNAPLATQAQASYKPAAPVVLAADSAVVQVAVAARNAQAQAGNGNQQARTEPAPLPWWRTLLNWWPAVALVAGVWLFWPAILALLRRLV